nr:MAG TPA: AntA/AntB antirepressor [Caudoviricetes sp.]
MSKPDNNHTPGGGQLIPITNMGEGDQAVQAVLGRDLHEYLEVGASYRHWFPRMVAYGFEEGVDYVVKNDRSASPAGMPSRPRLNHVVSLDMAKEIAMSSAPRRVGKPAAISSRWKSVPAWRRRLIHRS